MKPWLPGNHVCAVDMRTVLRDLGFMDYAEVHEIQLQNVEDQLNNRLDSEIIFITEHPSVFTLGRQGSVSGLLKSRDDITAEGVDIIHTERGGDITYHGPGQLVVYPILNLHRRKLAVSKFIYLLEEIMLKTAIDFGVNANRDERNRGIWVNNNKLGSVGIRVRRGITFHGLALNVNLSLEPFNWIQPCGLMGVGVTSLEKETGEALDLKKVKKQLNKHISELLCEERAPVS